MTPDQRFALILSAIGIVFIPTLAFIVRATIKWTRVEDKLSELVDDMRKLVEDKEKTHTDMIRQMAEDRSATNQRLRWLEENVWNRGNRPRPT
jgi:hypothetical protein